MFNSGTQDSSKEDMGNADNEEDSNNCGSRFRRLKSAFQIPLTEVHVAFYTAALPLFTNFNLFFQSASNDIRTCEKNRLEIFATISFKESFKGKSLG